MDYLFQDIKGSLHLISSVWALIFGTIILIQKKGSKRHKKIGYYYVASMIVLIVTSFMIYRLFKRFGIFHYAAIFSAINLLLGMLPILFKQPKKNYLFFHLNFMYWSVIGLYMAFTAEIATRIPNEPFFKMVYLASVIVLVLGFIGFFMKLKHWKEISGLTKNK